MFLNRIVLRGCLYEQAIIHSLHNGKLEASQVLCDTLCGLSSYRIEDDLNIFYQVFSQFGEGSQHSQAHQYFFPVSPFSSGIALFFRSFLKRDVDLTVYIKHPAHCVTPQISYKNENFQGFRFLS